MLKIFLSLFARVMDKYPKSRKLQSPPVKGKRKQKGHWRTYKNGKRVWVGEKR
jgi:hypothetical protein